MKNVIICRSCNAENSFHQFICKSCKAYLRERIVNIDLFNTLWLLIENPVRAYTRIIRAEHKNFIFILSILISIKFLIDVKFISLLINKSETGGNFLPGYFVVLGSLLIFVYLFSLILSFINKKAGLDTREKDNFSILVYSLFPHLLGLIFLLPVEAISFGQYLFLTNPSPFELKAVLAYTLLAFELLIILWSIYLSIAAMFTQSKNKAYAVIAGGLFQALLYGMLILLAGILFG